MANDRQKDDAKTPPDPDDAGKRSRDESRERPQRDQPARNGDVDEGLDETFPASDPPAPSRPTGET